MNTKTKDGTRARNGMPSVSMGIVPEFSAIFWTNWLLAAMAGEIGGHALNHIYLRRSGRVIVALMLCFLAMSILQGATRRLPRMIFLVRRILAESTGCGASTGNRHLDGSRRHRRDSAHRHLAHLLVRDLLSPHGKPAGSDG
jgi:hypothetical protein